MKDSFDLENTSYDLQNKQLLKSPERSTSKHLTQALCSRGNLTRSMVPNKCKYICSTDDFKKHIKDWKHTTCR